MYYLKSKILLITFLLSIPIFSNAQRQDENGSKDHPLISRYEGFFIAKYQEVDFDKYDLFVSSKEKKSMEGRIVKINYQKVELPRPSLYQVFKNYEQAIGAKNAQLLYSCQGEDCGKGASDIVAISADEVTLNWNMRFGKHAYQAWQFDAQGQTYYAALYFREEKNQMMYELHVVEAEEMSLDKVSVADIEKSVEETGKKVFYGIFFDFAKATIKAESTETLQVMADYLKNNADKKFFVVGHTDNIGDYTTNLTLSTQRAESLLKELSEKYQINTVNLQAVGVGPVAPIATNQTEKGRAKNRRVELVLDKK
ncbi:MAG: OmpA family protein [Bacteroidota bacterium]